MMIFMRFPEGRKKALTLSYDDGVRQDKRLVSIMNKYGIKGTFNVNSGCFAADDTLPNGEEKGRMSLTEAVNCYSVGGHEIAVHTYTHPFLNLVPSDNMAYEVVKDRERLEDIFGGIVKGMAYPMGTTSNETIEVLRACGISYARTTRATERFDIPTDWLKLDPTCHHKNPRLKELSHSFVSNNAAKLPMLFYLWGHSYEFDNDDNWEVIEEFCSFMGKREDIWYATNIEIFDYVEAYKRLKTSANGKTLYNPTDKTIWFGIKQNTEVVSIQPGQMIKL